MARRNAHHDYSHEDPHGDNLIEGLKGKVSTLKSMTVEMGDEIKHQNLLLKNMDKDFQSSWGLLSSSFTRVKNIAKSGQNKHILYLLLFSLLVFFILYIYLRTSMIEYVSFLNISPFPQPSRGREL